MNRGTVSNPSDQSRAATETSTEASVLQYVVDNLPYLIFWKNRESVYLGCNKGFAALDGRSDPKEMIGRTDFDMVWRDLAPAYRAGDIETMERGVPILHKEETSPDGQGGEMVILTSKVPLRNQAGEVVGLLGMIVDITERKRLELALQKAKEEAEQAARARSEFIANVTHELRTPLTLILGPVVEALGDASLDAKTRSLLERVQRNGFRLYNLVNDVLDVSKAEAGKTLARREQLDVMQVLRDVVADMQPLAAARGLELELRGESEFRAALDVRLFERIVLNLVGNGLKFTAPGGWVRIEVVRDAERFRVDVSDNGEGIDETTQARLFEKFVQGDGSATRKHEGTGLGLALVKHFSETLGGRVWVKSSPGQGATFSVELPIASAESVTVTRARDPEASEDVLGTRGFQQRAAGATTESRRISLAPDSSGPRPRVLVAEDNDDLRAYVVETLSSDFEPVGAANGAEAWKLLQQQRFDLVVSDVMMPLLDGIELTKKIKEHEFLSSLPVILLSARGGNEAASSGLDSGADDYLPKPFAANELRARTRAAYRMKRMQEQLREQSRAAGVAEVATGIVHNVGNVLNSVGISAGLLQSSLENSALRLLEKLAAALSAQSAQGAPPSPEKLASSLSLLAGRLAEEREEQLTESKSIIECVAHVREIVTSQQGLTRGFVAREATDPNAVLEQALTLSMSLLRKASIELEREHEPLPVLWIDPHILLQVFINVLNNARQALANTPLEKRLIRLRTRRVGDTVEVAISDNGEGIEPKNLKRIFQQGFTTKPQGQGFGLHMSTLNLRVLGGTISAESGGIGAGATFTLRLPVESGARAAE